ncbi:unnamed protein product [Heterobilharzia americana]|nr:unnamed protein product [Heterobilharzia americana]
MKKAEYRRRYFREYFHDLALVLIPEHGILRLIPKRWSNEEAEKDGSLTSRKQKRESLEILTEGTISVNEVLRYEVKDSEFIGNDLDARSYLVRPGLSARRFLIQWASQLGDEELLRIFSKKDSIRQRSSSAVAGSKFDNLEDSDFIFKYNIDHDEVNSSTPKLHRSFSLPTEIWFPLSVKETDDTENMLSSDFLPEAIAPPNSAQPTQSTFCSEPKNLMKDEILHSHNEIIDNTNGDELTDHNYNEFEEAIQSENSHPSIPESEEYFNLNTIKEDQEILLPDIENIISETTDEVQSLSDNNLEDIGTVEFENNLGVTKQSPLLEDDVFLSENVDMNDILLEHNTHFEEIHSNQNVQTENTSVGAIKGWNETCLPNKRYFTLKSLELNVSPSNVAPLLSRTKTLPSIKRKSKMNSKKTSVTSPNEVHVRGKRFKSDTDFPTSESIINLPPIISKPKYSEEVDIETNSNNNIHEDNEQHQKLGENYPDDIDHDGSEFEEISTIGIQHSLSFNTPVKCSSESVNKLPHITEQSLITRPLNINNDFILNHSNETSVKDKNESQLGIDSFNQPKHTVDLTCNDDDVEGEDIKLDYENMLLQRRSKSNISPVVSNTNRQQRQSITITLEPDFPLIHTKDDLNSTETSHKISIPFLFAKSTSNWNNNNTARIHKDVQFDFIPMNKTDRPGYLSMDKGNVLKSKIEYLTQKKERENIQSSETKVDNLELIMTDSPRKTWKVAKDKVTIVNQVVKRAIKPRPNPDDFCMTMWSYQEAKHEEVPLPELLIILLSGKPDLISQRIFSEIQPQRNLAQELRTAVETIYRVLPKSHAFGTVATLIGMRPGYKLEVQILRHGHTQKEYKNMINKTLIDAFKHSLIQQTTSSQHLHDLDMVIAQLSEVCSIVATVLIGSDTIKPGKNFSGLNLDILIMNLVKGAIYDTPLANRGVLSGLLAAAGGGVNALMGLIAAAGGGVEGLAKLLATSGNPGEAIGELLRSLSDDPAKALKELVNTMGGGVEGIKNILNALGKDKQKAFQELIQQVGGGADGLKNLFQSSGGIKELMEGLFGEGAEGLAGLIAVAGGDLEGLRNLIEAAGGGVQGIKNLITLGGDEVTGLKNLLSAIGGDSVADALTTLITAAGGAKDGLAALLQESGGGAKGLENLIEAVGGGGEGLKHLLKAAGDNPAEALANILAAAGGGVEGLKNLLQAVGGGAEGLKNLLSAMGDNPSEALANILKAAGGGAEALKNLLETIGGGAEGLQTLLQGLGGDPAQSLANLIASVGGGEEGLKNFIEAVGGGVTGLTNLLKSLGGSTKEALEALLTASGGGIEGLKKLVAAAGGGAEGLKNIIEAAGGGLDGLKNLLSSLGGEPIDALRSLLADVGGDVANLIAAAGGGVEGLKNLFNAVGGGVQGLMNLLNGMGDDMNEALFNLLNVTGDQKEDLRNLIEALGGGVEGFENFLKVVGDKIGIEGLLSTLGGGAEGLRKLLNSVDKDKDEVIRKLINASGGGVKGLAALLKATGGGVDAIKEILDALGGGHEALAKLLATCGDDPTEALKVLLEMLGGDENALKNLLIASGLDPNDPNALKLLFQALGGAENGLITLVNALGGGEEGMKKLLKSLGDDGLVKLVAAAGGGEHGTEALIKAMGGKGTEGLTALINLLGGAENGLATLIAAAGGGQAGLAALLKAAGKFTEDGDGLSALISVAGGGVEGLEALINAAGGEEEGLNNLLLAAGATDASSKSSLIKRLIEAGGGGQEGFNNLLKVLTRGKRDRPIDGFASLLKVLGNNPESLEILLGAVGGNADGLADLLAAAGGGAEALQLLINAAGGGTEGLVKLLAAAKLTSLEQLADALAAAGLGEEVVSAARAGDLSLLSEIVARCAAKEYDQRISSGKPKELCRERKNGFAHVLLVLLGLLENFQLRKEVIKSGKN